MNKVILLGRLTRNPEIRFSQNTNTKIATFSLAVNRKYVKTGEERQADFMNIVTYSKLADFTESYLKQGLQVCICGRIQTRSWETEEGQKRYATEIIAEEIDFADSFKKQGVDESILNGNGEKEQEKQNNEVTELESDDLPF